MNLTHSNGTAYLHSFMQNGFPKEMVLMAAIFATLVNLMVFIFYNISKATNCTRGYVVLSLLEACLNFFLIVTYVLKHTTTTLESPIQSTSALLIKLSKNNTENEEDSAYYFHCLFFTCILTRNFWRTIMSITSCCAILHPFWQFKYNIFNKKHQAIALVCILAISILLSVCYFVSFKFLPKSSQVAISRNICQSLVMSVIPGLIMLITAILVVRQLKKQALQLTQRKSCKASHPTSTTKCEAYYSEERKIENVTCVTFTGETHELESDPQTEQKESNTCCESTRDSLNQQETQPPPQQQFDTNVNYTARAKQNRLAAMIVVSLAVGFFFLEFVGDVWIFILQQMQDKSLDADEELPLPDFLVALDSCLNIFVLLIFNRTFRNRLWHSIIKKINCHPC